MDSHSVRFPWTILIVYLGKVFGENVADLIENTILEFLIVMIVVFVLLAVLLGFNDISLVVGKRPYEALSINTSRIYYCGCVLYVWQ